MSTVKAWIQASRLPSQSYIALPLVLGQLLAMAATGTFSWAVFALVQAFGIFDQLYIVYANDYADRETDGDNQTPTIFSGGSRVLVEGILTPSKLARASILMAILAMTTTAALAIGWQRFAAIPLGAFGLLLLWAYSYPPLRLSYRGGGEFLQMIGVGAVLTVLGYLAQAGTLQGFPWLLFATILPFSLATAIATSLPDHPADAQTQKRTLAVHFGLRPAQMMLIALNAVALGAFWIFGRDLVADYGSLSRALLITSAASTALLPGLILSRTGARPGTRTMVPFVFTSILANLAWTASVIIALIQG